MQKLDSLNRDLHQYDIPPKEINLIQNKLPFEIFEKILLLLNKKERYSTVIVNRQWNMMTLDSSGWQELSPIKRFLNILLKKFGEEKFAQQREEFKRLMIQIENFSLNDLPTLEKETNDLLDKIEKSLKSISPENLNSLNNDDLAIFFDSFEKPNKSKICYTFFYLSKKHSSLHNNLNLQIIAADFEKITDLLKMGAIATGEVLDRAITSGYLSSPALVEKDMHCLYSKIIAKLLKAGAKPTEKTLIYAITRKVPLEIIAMLLRKIAKPTEEALNTAIQFNYFEALIMLLEKGIKPTETILNQAIRHMASFEIIVKLLEAEATPTEETLNIIFDCLYGFHQERFDLLFEKLLSAKVKPTEKILNKAIIRKASLGVIVKLLEAGAKPTEDTFKKARLYKTSPEIMEELSKFADPILETSSLQ